MHQTHARTAPRRSPSRRGHLRRFDRQAVVENPGGAGGTIACGAVARDLSSRSWSQPAPAFDMKQLPELVGLRDVWAIEKRRADGR